MDWIWRSETSQEAWPQGQAPTGLTHGDDIEVMWHGGSTARGNLYSGIDWWLVTAHKHHGKIPRSDLDTTYGLVWEKRPGFNKIDRSYLRLVSA